MAAEVRQASEGAWVIENESLRVHLQREGLALRVEDKRTSHVWRMEPEGASGGFTIVKLGIHIDKPLTELRLDDWREAREREFHGVELRSVQPDPWLQYKVRVRVLLAAGEPELRIVVAPHEDPGYNAEAWIREVRYPRAFEHGGGNADRTVIPYRYGTLLPGDWPTGYEGEKAMGQFWQWGWEACTGPWWGHVAAGGAAYLAVIETPDDATLDITHPPGGPTRAAQRWLASHEALRYRRSMRYRFYDSADHVDLALDYRAYCQRIGRWRSIEEKRLEKPQLDTMLGAIGGALVVGEDGTERSVGRIIADITSLNRTPIRRRLTTFREIAGLLDACAKKYPDENKQFILAGWQKVGYDHIHPAACPPSPEAGGWKGLREVSETAKRHGMVFGLHEQYRDFFYSSPFWSERRTRKDARRDSPRHAYWAGGTQSILCPTLMLEYVKMNVQQLRDWDIPMDFANQDVLTAIPLEECFDSDHPATRTQCREARASIFDYYRQLGWLIQSESPSDWSADRVDAFRVGWSCRDRKDAASETIGIPVPLFSLVFHDCGILRGGGPMLAAMLCGANDFNVHHRDLRALHKQTAYMPLTAHTLLDDAGRRQESVFGGRVKVAVDFEAGTYRITGLDGPELSGTA